MHPRLMRPHLLWIIALAMLLAGCAGSARSNASATLATGFTILAKDYTYSPDTIEVQGNVPLAITLENGDGSIPHGLDVWPAGPYTGQPLFEGEVIYGVSQKTYTVPALRPGLYLFGCPRHDDERVLVTVRE